MKFRNGFVSNSSSSSFILGWRGDSFDACDVCGRSDPNIVDMCRNEDCGYSGDSTEVDWEGFDGWVNEWQDKKDCVLTTIKRIEGRNPDDLAYTWNSKITVRQALESAQEELKKIDATIARIKMYSVTEPNLRIACVSISYHSPLNDILDTMLTRGTVQEIDIDDICSGE
jgi:hypothetical protein